MAKARFGIFQSFLVVTLISVLPIEAMVLKRQKRDWMDHSPATFREGDLECFSDYMEVWIHRMRIEGLRLWLSGAMRIQVVNLGSLDRLNSQLSACGFSLHNDPDKNYIFRVMYSGCLVQQQNGNNVLVLNLAKGISRFGGRTQNFVMRCPLVSALSNTEHIQCDSDYIQVTRQIPQDSWNNELQWSLALRGSLIVALEDASLIQLNIDKAGTSLTLQGRRTEIMSPVTVLEKIGEFLALKLVSGQYAYSMEATCPEVSQISAEETVLHIFKRRMGLTKRGGFESDTFTLSNVSVDKTDVFTVHENRDFVQLVIPTALILQTKPCTTDQELLQPFYRVEVQLTFKETNHQMYWIMENSFPCTVSGTNAPIPTLRPTLSSTTSPAEAYTTGSETGDPNTTLKPTVSYPTSPTDALTTMDDDQITTTTATMLPIPSYTLSMPETYTTAPVTNEQRLPVTRDDITRTPKPTLSFSTSIRDDITRTPKPTLSFSTSIRDDITRTPKPTLSFSTSIRDDITRTPKPTLSFSTSIREAFTAYRTGSGTDGSNATAPVDLTTAPVDLTTAPVDLTTASVDLTTAPVDLTTAPVDLTTAPVDLTTAPVDLTTAPVDLTTAPVDLTTAPVDLTTAPVDLITAPVGLTTAPVVLTTAPVDLTTTPVDITTAPVDLTTAPVDLTTAPVDLTTAPVDLTTAPVDLITAPVDLTTAPVDLTSPPVDLTTAPVDLTTAPVDLTTTAPVDITTAPVDLTTTPVDLTTTPVDLTTAPVDLTTAPVELTTAPVDLTTAPVDLTTAPVVLTTAPVELTTAPVELTTAPVDLTTAPLDLTTAPVDITTAPVDLTTAPVDLTTSPVDITTAPVDLTTAPVDITNAPVDLTTAPVDLTTAPVDLTTAPVDLTTAPLDLTTAPVDLTTAPLDLTTAPVDLTTAPVDLTTAPVDLTTAPVDLTTAPVDLTTAPVVLTTAPVDLTTAPVDLTTAPVDITTAPVDLTTAPLDIITAPVDLTTAPVDLTTAPVELTTAPVDLTTALVDLTTVSIPNPLKAALSSSPDVYTTAPAKPPGTSTHLHLSPDPPVEDLAVTWTDVSTSYPPDPATASSDSHTYTSNVTPLDLHGNEATRNTTEAADVGGAGAQDRGPQGVTLGSAGTRQPNQTESQSPQDGNRTRGTDFHSNSGTTESDRGVTEAMFQVGFQ